MSTLRLYLNTLQTALMLIVIMIIRDFRGLASHIWSKQLQVNQPQNGSKAYIAVRTLTLNTK